MSIDRSTGFPASVRPQMNFADHIKLTAESVDVAMENRIPLDNMLKMLSSKDNAVQLAQGKAVTLRFNNIPGFNLVEFCREFKCAKGVGDSDQIGRVCSFLHKYFQDQSESTLGLNFRWADWHTVESAEIECSLRDKKSLSK